MKHHCHAYHCAEPCAPKLLMCAYHWGLVPSGLKREVNRHFSPAQCRPGSGVRPSTEWLRAARAAINSVRADGGGE